MLLLAVGLTSLGRWLRSEDAVERLLAVTP
jgi:hypothetical protein